MTAIAKGAKPVTPTVTEKPAVLTGHTSFETALEADDYPYGFKVRTKIRYWVETATKGAKAGEVRFVTRTLNPATGRWNKPKGSTYSTLGWMYRDPRTGYVEWCAASGFDVIREIARVKAMGLWDGIPAEDRDALVKYDEMTRTRMPDYCADWDNEVAEVRTAVAAHGAVPDLYAKAGLTMYKGEFEAIYAMVKAEVAGEYTLPKLAA